MENKQNLLSRRRILKIGTALFSFIPAALYLKDAPKAFAFVPCVDENTSTSCDDWYCVDICDEYEWARLCSSYGVRSNEECDSWVEYGGLC